VAENNCTTQFTIPEKNNNAEVCSPPNNINPGRNKIFTDKDLLRPLVFNWSPVIIPNHGLISYKLEVWEVEEGQTNAQAIYNNSPIIEAIIKA
jgi:hypothetical protein